MEGREPRDRPPLLAEDPEVARTLFADFRLAWVWLAVRVYLGWTWLEAGRDKLANPVWMDGRAAVPIPGSGVPPADADRIVAGHWSWDSQRLPFGAQGEVWLAGVAAVGETLVGIALILGLLTGIVALVGGVLDFALLPEDATGLDPLLFALAVGLVLAWKTGGVGRARPLAAAGARRAVAGRAALRAGPREASPGSGSGLGPMSNATGRREGSCPRSVMRRKAMGPAAMKPEENGVRELEAPRSRRSFVKLLGKLLGMLGVGTAGTAAAAADGLRGGGTRAASAAETGHGHGGPAAPSAQQAEMTADEMDAMHEAGVKSFPAPTAGLGGQPLPFEMDGDVKVFRLECQYTQWEVSPGEIVEAWTYNGVVPGPEIRVTEGDKIRVHVTNYLGQSTAVHWHGLMLPNNQDGVPFITQPPIKPGTTHTYEFPIREGNAGTHMYHSHHNAAEQVTKGLLGAFIVEPKDPATRPAFDREYTIVLNDGPIGGFSLNGKSFPATQPLGAKKGERVLIRYMNEGLMIHPMHLHGMPMTVTAQDGYLLPQPYVCDTLNIAPGQRFEAIVDATEVGVWAFHCHILNHAESEHGMFGMVTVLTVDE